MNTQCSSESQHCTVDAHWPLAGVPKITQLNGVRIDNHNFYDFYKHHGMFKVQSTFFGLCLPAECSTNELKHLGRIIASKMKLPIQFQVKCNVRQSDVLDAAGPIKKFAATFCMSICIMVVMSTLLTYFNPNLLQKSFLAHFSSIEHFKRLMNLEPTSVLAKRLSVVNFFRFYYFTGTLGLHIMFMASATTEGSQLLSE